MSFEGIAFAPPLPEQNIATRLIAGALFTALISGTSAIASAAGYTDSLEKTVKYTDVSVSTAKEPSRASFYLAESRSLQKGLRRVSPAGALLL